MRKITTDIVGADTVIKIPVLSTYYVDNFLRLKCAPDLLASKVFPNSKEITESMTAYQAVVKTLKRHFSFDLIRDPTVNLFDVGSGTRPRTAALFAFRSAWQTYAIDPNLNDKKFYSFQRVNLVKARIEDVTFTSNFAVIVCVHAHVKLDRVLKSLPCRDGILVAMPCCQPLKLDSKPDYEYQDKHCLSPERTVKIWIW